MKIVVYKVSDVSWRWAIEGENRKRVAVGFTWYSRKSDAKRGAARFEQKLYHLYSPLYPSSGMDEINLGMPIEVIE